MNLQKLQKKCNPSTKNSWKINLLNEKVNILDYQINGNQVNVLVEGNKSAKLYIIYGIKKGNTINFNKVKEEI